MALHWILIALIIGIAVGPMVYEMARGQFDPFDVKNPFLLYYALQLGFSAMVTLLAGSQVGIGLDIGSDPDAYVRALALAAAGVAAFQVGHITQRPRPLSMPRLITAPWRLHRVSPLVATYFVLGFGSFALLLRQNGGFSEFLANREVWRGGGMVGQGFLLFPATTLLGMAANTFLIASTGNGAPSRRRLLVCVGLYLIALVPPFVFGFRSTMALPLIQLLLIWQRRVARIPPLRFAALLGVLALGFTAYGIAREIPSGVSVDFEQVRTAVQSRPELAYSVIARVRGIEVVATVMKRLDETHEYDLNWKSVVEMATIMIPGKLWPGKPQSSIERFTTYFFGGDFQLTRGSMADTFGGVSPTVVGELYWHFGAVGVLLGLYLLGRFARVAYATFRAKGHADGVHLLYAMSFTAFAMTAENVQGYVNGYVLILIALTATLCALVMRFAPSLATPTSATAHMGTTTRVEA